LKRELLKKKETTCVKLASEKNGIWPLGFHGNEIERGPIRAEFQPRTSLEGGGRGDSKKVSALIRKKVPRGESQSSKAHDRSSGKSPVGKKSRRKAG